MGINDIFERQPWHESGPRPVDGEPENSGFVRVAIGPLGGVGGRGVGDYTSLNRPY